MKNILYLVFISFLLITCKEDPCSGVICQNGGTCAKGNCLCSERYEGAFCEKQVTPEKLRIGKVTVTRFPATSDGGASWDQLPSSGADLFVAIFKGNDNIFQSGYYANANPNGFNEYTPASTLDLEPKTIYEIWLVDDDSPLDPDIIAAYEFDINDSDMEGFPETISIGDSEVQVQFDVEYIF
jgi:hypothetical protein